jgi:hypothetical protein
VFSSGAAAEVAIGPAGAARRLTAVSVTMDVRSSPLGGSNMYLATFTVPIGLEPQLARNAINARGASFALEVGPRPGTVITTFYSCDPTATGEALRSRLEQRLMDPSPPGAEDCSIM